MPAYMHLGDNILRCAHHLVQVRISEPDGRCEYRNGAARPIADQNAQCQHARRHMCDTDTRLRLRFRFGPGWCEGGLHRRGFIKLGSLGASLGLGLGLGLVGARGA